MSNDNVTPIRGKPKPAAPTVSTVDIMTVVITAMQIVDAVRIAQAHYEEEEDVADAFEDALRHVGQLLRDAANDLSLLDDKLRRVRGAAEKD